MKQKLFLALFTAMCCVLGSCGNKHADKQGAKSGDTLPDKEKQLNVSILLDLSDRISPVINPATPSHSERDIAVVQTMVKAFKKRMKEEGAYKAKGKIQVLFSPEPNDKNINALAEKLRVNLAALENKQKKEIYDNIEAQFEESLAEIYRLSIDSQKWNGADIWRFFKNDVHNYCVDKESRNVLILITDGYLFHSRSKDKENNRYAYLTGPLLDANGLRNNTNWKSKIEQMDFGLIAKRNDLQELEVLVLEITPFEKHPNDEDIIKFVLTKWFREMGVEKIAIYNTALPANTEKNILRFLFG